MIFITLYGGDSRHGSSFFRISPQALDHPFLDCSLAGRCFPDPGHIFLVGPVDTLRALCEQIVLPDFWSAIVFSFWRISIGFFLAFFLGLFTGSLAYRFPIVDEFLEPPVQLMRLIRRVLRDPGTDLVAPQNLSVFISFLVVYPMIHVNTKAGLISADRELLATAVVFHIPFIRRALYIYRTALYPYLKSACRTALGMGFKSGIAAEVIGVPDGSIGEGLYLAKIYLSTAELFAWTVVIILVSSLFEKGFLWILKKCAGKGADVNESDQ
ncbi:MAG: nitrate ABC transporter permease [Lachnospiraceae bacterium]